MLAAARQRDFVPALVVLWGNYVPDTWMSTKFSPGNVMPFDAVKPYAEYAARKFASYDPIFIISGDSDFPTEATNRTYMAALEAVKSVCPDALTTMHMGPNASLPDEFVRSGLLDFYLYQSGHEIGAQSNNYLLAEKFLAKPVKRPIVNGEPCYETTVYGKGDGRYNEYHVRKVLWQSVLSGAKAGVAYGANGTMIWYREGKEFWNEGYAGRPMPWRATLGLKGAWDASFVKWIMETYDLFDMEPADLVEGTREVRMSITKDGGKVAIYIPYNMPVRIKADLSSYDFTLINLADRLIARPIVTFDEGVTTIKMHGFNADTIVIGMKCGEAYNQDKKVQEIYRPVN